MIQPNFSISFANGLSLGVWANYALDDTHRYGSESYHSGYFGVSDSSLSDYNLSALLSYAVTDKITVTPTVSYSAFLDSDIGDAADVSYEEDSNFYGGMNVSFFSKS